MQQLNADQNLVKGEQFNYMLMQRPSRVSRNSRHLRSLGKLHNQHSQLEDSLLEVKAKQSSLDATCLKLHDLETKLLRR